MVREPFLCKVTGTSLTAGLLEPGEELMLKSHMPEGEVFFSEGIEADALAFNPGTVATIRTA